MRWRVLVGDGDVAFGGEEGIVRVVGGVEQILVVKLAEDGDHLDVAVGHGLLRMGFQDALKADERAVVIEDVKVLVPVMDRGIEVERIGMQCVAGGCWWKSLCRTATRGARHRPRACTKQKRGR